MKHSDRPQTDSQKRSTRPFILIATLILAIIGIGGSGLFLLNRDADRSATVITELPALSNVLQVVDDDALIQSDVDKYDNPYQTAKLSIRYKSRTAQTCDPLPQNWNSEDIGNVMVAGTACYSNNVFTISGSGSDIYGNSDEYHYAYQSFDDDGYIIARVYSQENTNQWATSGIMFRETLNDDSRHAFMAVTPQNGITMRARTSSGGSTSTTTTSGNASTPIWVKLVREGDNFTSYYSSDGVDWSYPLDTYTIEDMNSSIYVGLAVSAHDNSISSEAVFTDVKITHTDTILFAADSMTLSGGDMVMRDRLRDLGYAVVVVSDEDVVVSDVVGKDILFISYSVDDSIIGDMFSNTAVPVFLIERYLYDDMRMSVGQGGQGTRDIDAVDTTHPLAAGFQDETVRVGYNHRILSYGTGWELARFQLLQ